MNNSISVPSIPVAWSRGSQGYIRSDQVRVSRSYKYDVEIKCEVPDYWRVWGPSFSVNLPKDKKLPEVLAWVDENYPLSKANHI